MTNSSQFVPAAQYLRMSTEHQQYSLENQERAIADYAALHGFEIVRKYQDAAKSGLTIKNRTGLRALIGDIVTEEAAFAAVLVYDVSRWGRFQDTDEAAYYEFLCKHFGVSVEYCAEPFKNDGTLPSLILKAIKRTMASEYSRELGAKVSAGQRRLAELGYHMGGTAPFGLRRLLISSDGTPKQILRRGEEKSISTDRIIMVPGPADEIRTVRQVFRMARRGKRPIEIVRYLNPRGIPYFNGKPWREHVIQNMLRNPAYAGDNCWARTTRKLMGPTKHEARQDWAYKADAFDPLISHELFEEVQRKIQEWSASPSNAELISQLRSAALRRGKMSALVLDEEHRKGRLNSRQMYHCRFGTLSHMYELIHYVPKKGIVDIAKHRIETQEITSRLIEEIKERFPAHIEIVHLPGKVRKLLRIDDFFNVAVVVCSYSRRWECSPHWLVKPLPYEHNFITLVCRLDKGNDSFLDFRLLPSLRLRGLRRLKETDYPFNAGERLDVANFYYVARRLFERGKQLWRA